MSKCLTYNSSIAYFVKPPVNVSTAGLMPKQLVQFADKVVGGEGGEGAKIMQQN